MTTTLAMAFFEILLIGLLVAALLVLGLRLLYPLPPLEPRAASFALNDTNDTRLGRAIAPMAAQHPGLSGIYPLDDAREAFAARLLLARRAERSLDLQYYIWHGDISGTLLLDEMRKAADRGVRVRILLDDNGIAGLDMVISAFDTHPKIEVRLFNPFVIRRPKAIGYLLDFLRLNRRMHNKGFTADNQATIVGGRNVGDEYFGASEKALFADLDVFAVGAVVAQVSADFDRYWACGSAYPSARILKPTTAENLVVLAATAKQAAAIPLAREYAAAVADSVVRKLLTGNVALEWAPVAVMSDDPAKGLGNIERKANLGPLLAKAIGKPITEIGLVSAYFVPTDAGVEAFAEMARAGVAIQVMTNALKTNDVAMVHAGYSHSRKPLLKAGVRLWEMKGADPDKRAKLKFSRRDTGRQKGTIFRSSGSALHAKTFTVDRKRMFVGSFNFDPRSLRTNTEMGFIIDSPVLAGRLQDMFVDDVANIAYELRLAGRRLEWIERTPDGEVIHRHEPGTGPLQRLVMAVLSHLPLKWLL